MNDPAPENITGEKRHIFKHQINWSHVAIAAVLLVVAWRVLPSSYPVTGSGKQDDPSEESEPEIPGEAT